MFEQFILEVAQRSHRRENPLELHRASFHRKKLGSQQPHLVASTMPAFAVCVYAAALDASFRRRPRGNSLSGVASSFERAAATAAKRSTIAIRGAEAQRASPRARHKDPQDKRPMAPLLHLRRTSLSPSGPSSLTSSFSRLSPLIPLVLIFPSSSLPSSPSSDGISARGHMQGDVVY